MTMITLSLIVTAPDAIHRYNMVKMLDGQVFQNELNGAKQPIIDALKNAIAALEDPATEEKRIVHTMIDEVTGQEIQLPY